MPLPQADREAALKRGADELQGRLEWTLRGFPLALARKRREDRQFGERLYRAIERAAKVRR